MKPPLCSWILLAVTLLAGLPGPVRAGDKNPVPASAATTAAAPGAGWLNDQLRKTSPSFKEWDIGGQIRLRYELTDDAGSYPNRDFIRQGLDNDNDYFLFREKLHVGWNPESWLKVYAEGRGAQTESDTRDPSPGQDRFDLHQAWVDLGDPAIFPFSLKAGRQEMLYGDQRFIGVADWNNTGRSFDAVRLRWHAGKKSWVDGFTARVVIPRDEYFNESNEDDQFSGIYASSQELWQGVETQAYFLARNTGAGSPNAIAPGIGGPSERDVYTYGTRIKSQPGEFSGWDFAFEGAGQFGSVVAGGVNRDLRAFALAGSAGYTMESAAFKPRLGIGYDYASGDSDAADDRQETFEPLFGTNHAFYGVADLVGLRNLSSPRVSLSAKPLKDLTVSLDYLVFWLADAADSFYPESGPGRSGNGYGRDGSLSSFVGSELDLQAKYRINAVLEAQMGYAHFFAGDYIRESVAKVPANGGTTDADWFYVQISLNF